LAISRAVSCIFATREHIEKDEMIWTGINSETKRIHGSYLMLNVDNSWNKYLAARKPDKTNID
jgi:hypothetical protein